MKNLYKILYSLLLLIAAASSVHAESKVSFVWAADAEGNAPYIFQDPNSPDKLIGFEKDFAEALAAEMQLEPIFFQNQWDGLIPGLDRKDYDIVINGIEVTADRARKVNFSFPYYYTHEQIVVNAYDDDIENLNGLKSLKVGALKFSLAEKILKQQGDITVLSYEGEANAFADLENGRLNAVLVDAPIALYQASWRKNFKLTGQPIGRVIYAAALRKSDSTLHADVNTAITNLITSGKLKEILCRWKLWNNQTAENFNDSHFCASESESYKEFVQTQTSNSTFSDVLERYIGFLPLFGKAAITTLEISILSMILALFTGLFIALMKVYAPLPLSKLATLYIEIVRGTPLLIQLFLIFYGLPSIGIKLSPMTAAVLCLGLNYAAFEAENFRAGLESIPKGQTEAALSLGMSKIQAIRHIEIPQAIRFVIPPITNDFISLLKDSSLVSVITMVELTKLYGQLASAYYDYIGIGIMVAIIYLLIGLPFVKLSRYAETYFVKERKNIY